VKYSIKHLLHTPVKVLLFSLSILLCTVILIIGLLLWLETDRKIQAVEAQFTTIGMVEQRPDVVELGDTWDAGLGGYTHFSNAQYHSVVSLDVLKREGLDYVCSPEKRPYYGAYMEEYNLSVQLGAGAALIEFSPEEDCVPDHPVPVEVKRVLGGSLRVSEKVNFCDHFTNAPPRMEAGKTYIVHGVFVSMHPDMQQESQVEFVPMAYPFCTQCDKDGNKVRCGWSCSNWEEVTDDFYTSGNGRYWLAFAESYAMKEHTFAVLPTESLALLPSFHSKRAVLTEGRAISDEEFASGALVCMLSKQTALANGLHVGDTVSLPLYYANYNHSPGMEFGTGGGSTDASLLNSEGEIYPVFWRADYQIVGLYQDTAASTQPSEESDIGRDLFIIPQKSVGASDEHNIVDYGPMRMFTTSFQIPNGTAAEFEEALQAYPESSFLDIRYDDNGYEQVHGRLKNTQTAALLLIIGGVCASCVVLSLMLYFFIAKQKKRTVIERALGMTKRQCRVSLISGLMVVVLIASAAGSLVSTFFASQIDTWTQQENSESMYSTKYSVWAVGELDAALDLDEPDSAPAVLTYVLVPMGILFFAWAFSELLTSINTRADPMELLNDKG